MGKETSSNANRVKEIEIVMKERSDLVDVCSDLIILINKDWSGKSNDKDSGVSVEIQRRILQVSQHLANIGGFCDGGARRKIQVLQNVFTQAMLPDSTYVALKFVLPIIVGIQVDFTHTPFRILGFSLKGMGVEVKTLIKR